MINVNFYTFGKRCNSTKIVDSAAVEMQCALKSPTSIIHPMLEIHAENPTAYNYAYIPAWNRYYWVDNWTWDSGLWVAALHVDVLSSWRDNIGNSSQYVLRSSYTFDGSIADSLYPGTSKMSSKSVETDDNFWGIDDAIITTAPAGCFVVGIVGASATDYYLMGSPGLQKFLDYIYSDDFADQIIGSGATVDLPEVKLNLNPVNYIKSIVYYPFVPTPLISEPATSIRVGWGAVPNDDISALKIKNYTIHKRSQSFSSGNISSLQHPQSARGKYLNTAPYTQYYIYWPGFGKISLDADVVANCSALTMQAMLDLKSGECVGRVYATVGSTSYLMSRLTTSIGMNIQVSQVLSTGYGNLAGITDNATVRGAQLGVMKSVMGAGENLSEGKLFGAISGGIGAVQGIYGAFSAMASVTENKLKGRVPTLTTVGTNSGTLAGMGGPVILFSDYQYVTDDDNDDCGRPLCQFKTLADIPGFIMCMHADISIPATDAEIKAILSFMESGFFFE